MRPKEISRRYQKNYRISYHTITALDIMCELIVDMTYSILTR